MSVTKASNLTDSTPVRKTGVVAWGCGGGRIFGRLLAEQQLRRSGRRHKRDRDARFSWLPRRLARSELGIQVEDEISNLLNPDARDCSLGLEAGA